MPSLSCWFFRDSHQWNGFRGMPSTAPGPGGLSALQGRAEVHHRDQQELRQRRQDPGQGHLRLHQGSGHGQAHRHHRRGVPDRRPQGQGREGRCQAQTEGQRQVRGSTAFRNLRTIRSESGQPATRSEFSGQPAGDRQGAHAHPPYLRLRSCCRDRKPGRSQRC